jgi:chaperone BCS1
LAVLLYGEPGCGKSSTIETIGSYLQKDIYNLNLQSVQTNEDLARLWDYVTNQTKNGGCIVLEDVDAQSDIVLARTLQSTNNHITILTPNETPLSLSFFLNLIQGSSQRDGQVFVTTTNWIEKLDPAFTRSMRFDVKIEMKPADYDQITEIYSVYFPRRKVPLEKIKAIPEYKYTPAMFIDCFRQYIKNPDFTDEELFADFL